MFEGNVREGLSLDEWPERGDVVAQLEKEDQILNQDESTLTSYTYSKVMSNRLNWPSVVVQPMHLF
jgi:hypothetical protein